jgi:hypothetical protein
MNRKIIVLTTAFLMSVSVMFAQDVKPVPAYIVKELHTEFTNVSNLQWKTVDQFYKASFITDGTALDVFYSGDGTLAAVARKLTVDQLPLVLAKEVKEKAMKHTISELFELLTDKGTEYFLIINNEKETKRFRSEGQYWTRY